MKLLPLYVVYLIVLDLSLAGPLFVPGAALELEPGKTVLDVYLEDAVGQAVQSHLGGGAGGGGGGGGEAGAGK